ncbi:TPA: hypothetical protein JS309_004368 [Escherichia coli]|nr:hypothetical protein [Escherichia coli]
MNIYSKSIKNNLFLRYLKLFDRWNVIPVNVRMTDIADVLACTPRYARTLIKKMGEEGWLSWTSGQGRGASGYLHCFVSQIGLNNIEDKNHSINPPQNREQKCENNTKNNQFDLYIKFYRPLAPIVPSEHTGRPEQHLMNMVHAGLTRLTKDGELQPDLAHQITSRDNYRKWFFFLRNNLIWHDETFALPTELYSSILKKTHHKSLSHIKNIELNKNVIEFTLSYPDALFAHRLANQIFFLSKPNNEEVGLGSFRIVCHSETSLILERSLCCHRSLPQINRIIYKITPRNSNDWRDVSILTENITNKSQLNLNKIHSGFQFLAFNENRNILSNAQKCTIRVIAQECTKKIRHKIDVLKVPDEFEPPKEMISETILPPFLEMGYFWTPENEKWCVLFKKYLMYYKCELRLYPVSSANWYLPSPWENYDIALSGMKPGKVEWLHPEFRLRNGIMINKFMSCAGKERVLNFLSKISTDKKRYPIYTMKLIRILVKNHWLLPLYCYKFRVLTDDKIRGIEISEQGWPDFSKLWVND